MSKPTGGPAFPVKANHEGIGQYDSNGVTVQHTGLTLRDYFAGKAMQGELSSQPHEISYYFTKQSKRDLAEWSYSMADAMLAARDES